MNPKHFKQANERLTKPQLESDKTPQFIDVYNDIDDYKRITKVTLWSCSFWERIKFLFHGNIWIGVMVQDNRLPPIWVECEKEISFEAKEK